MLYATFKTQEGTAEKLPLANTIRNGYNNTIENLKF